MGFTLAGNLVDSILPAAPQAPSTAHQMASLYAMIAGDDFAKSQGYKDTKAMVADKGLAYVQAKLQEIYGPEFEQLQYDSIARTAPEMAALNLRMQQQFQGPMLQNEVDSMKRVDPNFFAIRDKMSGMLSDNLGKGLNDEQSAFFGNRLNDQANAHGMGDSPLSWANQSKALTGMNFDAEQTNFNNAQGFLNSYRLFPTQNVGMSPLGGSNMLTGPSFGDLANNQTNTNAFNLSMVAKRYSDIASFGGSMMGMFGGGGGGGGSTQVPSYGGGQDFNTNYYNAMNGQNGGMI